MMNPIYHFERMRELIKEFEPSRERSLAATKLEECEMWLAKCRPTLEAVNRDQANSEFDPSTGRLRQLPDSAQNTPEGGSTRG